MLVIPFVDSCFENCIDAKIIALHFYMKKHEITLKPHLFKGKVDKCALKSFVLETKSNQK
jgi:hypothetical protein